MSNGKWAIVVVVDDELSFDIVAALTYYLLFSLIVHKHHLMEVCLVKNKDRQIKMSFGGS